MRSSDEIDAEQVVRKASKFVMYGVGVLFLLMLLWSSMFVVQPTQMGGERILGKVVTSQPIGPGLHFKIPFIETADTIQTSQSTYDLNNMQVYTADNQSVNIGINVIYQIPRSSVLHLLYDVGRTGSYDINDTILPVVRDRALATFAQYNTLNISEQRAEIAMKMQKDIAQGLMSKFGIQIIGVQLINIKYSPTFVQSVEAAVRAKALAVQAQNTVLQKQYEGQQAVVTAKAQADAAIARANGEAQATLITAQANAKAIQTMGEALQSNPNYIKYVAAKAWNGQYPNTLMTGGKSPVPLFDLGNVSGK